MVSIYKKFNPKFIKLTFKFFRSTPISLSISMQMKILSYNKCFFFKVRDQTRPSEMAFNCHLIVKRLRISYNRSETQLESMYVTHSDSDLISKSIVFWKQIIFWLKAGYLWSGRLCKWVRPNSSILFKLRFIFLHICVHSWFETEKFHCFKAKNKYLHVFFTL